MFGKVTKVVRIPVAPNGEGHFCTTHRISYMVECPYCAQVLAEATARQQSKRQPARKSGYGHGANGEH